MGRSRNIKPGFFKNDDLAQCEYGARLVFAGLWTLADREGRLEDRPLRIKAEIMPFDNCDVNNFLDQLARRGFITRYENAGCKYIQVNNFSKHQNPHVKEQASTIPAPDLHQSSRADSLLLIPDSLLPLTDSLKPHSQGKPGYSPDFIRFWNEFPKGRKTGKAAAYRSWKVALKRADAETIIAAAIEYAAAPIGRSDFVKGPTPWLNQGCWEDDREAWQRGDTFTAAKPPVREPLRMPTPEELANHNPAGGPPA